MRITWLTSADVCVEHGRATSEVASARYRVLIPAEAMYRAHHHVSVMTLKDLNNPSLRASLTADIVVFSNSLQASHFKLAEEAQLRGAKVVFDICDDEFSNPELGHHFRDMADIADAVVTNSENLALRIEQYMGTRADVIGDPYAGPAGEVKFSPNTDRLNALWFGHTLNFDDFVGAIPFFNATSTVCPIDVTAMTGPLEGIDDTFTEFNAKTQFPVRLSYQPWSLPATWAALAQTDIVVIPNSGNEKSKTKSANRAIEALRAGRFVVAQPMPAYQELRNYIYLGEDLSAGMIWALQHPQEAWTRIAQGQRAISENFAPDIIAKQWLRLFMVLRTCAPRSRQAPQTAAPHVRLNLGCGDIRLPGYINIDITDERLGIEPDIHSDMGKLDRFADNSVDEILSIHKVQHFWRWEVLDILREWVRTLKPGGKIIIECPNLLTACIEFVNNPEHSTSESPEGQRIMGALYGDLRMQDPATGHRWGYTPQSLAKLMMQAGLVNVHQDAAQFKLHEPRDMRVAGEKPLANKLL